MLLHLTQLLVFPLKLKMPISTLLVKFGGAYVGADGRPLKYVDAGHARGLCHVHFLRIAAEAQNNCYVVIYLTLEEAVQEFGLLVINLEQQQVARISLADELRLRHCNLLFRTDRLAVVQK